MVGWECPTNPREASGLDPEAVHLVFLSVGIHLPYVAALFIVPVGGLAEGLSVLPGGIGSVEPGLIGLLVLFTSANLATATTVVILYRLVNYWFRIGLGFLALPVLGVGDVLQKSLTDSDIEG